MRTPITGILALIALVLAILAILGVVLPATALGLAVICLALALLLPDARFGRYRDTDRP
jgi:hypothetical protein